MYIPTQEERYSKCSWMTLLLCVMIPSAVYCYFSIAPKLDQTTLPMDSLSGMLNIAFFFSYPLALLFRVIGMPDMSWGNLPWGIMLPSLLVHLGLIGVVKYHKVVTPKRAIAFAITLGMLDFLMLKIINAYPA